MNVARSQSLPAFLSILSILVIALPVVAAADDPRLSIPTDPFADPRNDPFNPLKYITSNALTGVAVSLIFIVGLLQTWCLKKWGAKWMLSMVIGIYTFTFGLATRFGLHIHPRSKEIYIVEYIFVVLSPCAFIAADYILLGRLARHIDSSEHLLVAATKITKVFIASDVSTFLIQAVGGILSASANDRQRALVGSRIFLTGLVLQLCSFLIFTCIFLVFLYRVHKHKPETWAMNGLGVWYKDWRALATALWISCIGILIRSCFRVVELGQGFQGYLATSEAFFYGLDTLPLFFAIVVYVPFWPGRFISTPPIATPTLGVGHGDSVDSEPKINTFNAVAQTG